MIGFDYGTSNCSVAIMADGQPQIIPLLNANNQHSNTIASNLYAPDRDIIVHWLYQKISSEQQISFKDTRSAQLQKAQRALRELNFDGIATDLLFGKTALDKYLEDPEEGYYIKSPKSFLGASGLAPMQRQLQGLHGEESNRQAITVLTNAAKRVGFKDVEFQYEPVAAGFEFEASLDKETKVLVVDIGGGTSDCSMLLMGPKFRDNTDRTQHLLAHSGVRIAGNDFDIQLALQGIMPSLGMNGLIKTGKSMPTAPFYQALAINNINKQTDFYSAKNRRDLIQLSRDAKESAIVERLITVHDHKLSYQLVNAAEQAKISLSEQDTQVISLEYIEEDLAISVDKLTLKRANNRTLASIGELMQSAIKQAQSQPDVIFITGGTAKSPVISEYIQQQMPNTPVVIGDHFGSVTSGLARWAEKIYN